MSYHGVTFQISIRRDSQGAAGSNRTGSPEAGDPKLSPDAIDSRAHRSLLITDDDSAFRETLRGIFEDEGFRILLADSGEAALDILHDQPVDVALLDHHLPRLTGLETLRILRQTNAALPVILLTGDNTQQLLRDALSAQAFCVMSKPVSRNAVVYTVQRALARSYQLNLRISGSSDLNIS